MTDQRKDKRFKSQDNFLWLRCSRTASLGQIMDISSGGLAFSYLSEDEFVENRFEHVTIFDRVNVFGTAQLLSRSDFGFKNPSSRTSSFHNRRRGAQFVGRSSKQATMISSIKSKHTS